MEIRDYRNAPRDTRGVGVARPDLQAGDAHDRGLHRDSATRRALYAALVAPDGSFGTEAKGTAQLAELAAKTNKDRSGPAFTRHFVTNVVIKPASGGATGRSYLVALDISEGGKPTTILAGGHYDDVYVKTPQGWRIKSRTYVRSEIGPQQ